MMHKAASAFLISLSVFGKAYAEPISGSRTHSGPWEIEAFTNDDTGEFSHCVSSAFYKHNNTRLNFSLHREYMMSIGVYDFYGRFPENTDFPVTLRVDKRKPFFGNAATVGKEWAIVTLTQMDAALDAMRRGQFLVIESSYGSFEYGLNGTFRALEGTYNCAANYYSYQSPARNRTSSAEPDEWQPNRSQERRMLQLSAAIAADMGQTGIIYRDDESPVATWDSQDGAMWVTTAIGRLTGASINLSKEFSLDMGNLSASCGGTLATVSDSHSIQGVQTTESNTQCLLTNGNIDFRMHIIRQVINEELIEIVIYLDGSAVSDTESSSGQSGNLGLSIATLSASYLSE